MSPLISTVCCVSRAKKELTEEDRLSQAKSLFSDFLASNDLAEALVTAREIVAPGVAIILLLPRVVHGTM
jgi:hypothetical protein